MSIGAIANIVNTNLAETAASRPDPTAADTGQVEGSPQADDQQDATVTTLSPAALALQATDDQAALDAAAPASASALTSVLYLEWAPGVPTDGDGAVQEALNALTDASRENLQATADALATSQDQAAAEQRAIDDAAALADEQRDTTVLFAMNAEIRLAYGALPSPTTGDPVPREPGQVDVIA